MVDLIHPARRQSLRLIGRQEPQAGADFQVVPRLDLRDNFFNRLNFPLARPAGRNDDAISLASTFHRETRTIEQLFAAEQVVARNVSRRGLRLRAVVAIFRAQAAFGVHQEVKLHRVAEPAAADFVRGRENVQQLLIRSTQDCQAFLLCGFVSAQNSLC